MKAEDNHTEHMRATVEIDAWIRTRRQQVQSEEMLMDAISGRETVEESGALYRLARPVLERYERHLEKTDTVDHEGTILKAWQYLRDSTVTPLWKAILVDEYQDVNPAQAAFVHALLTPREPGRASTGARLTAVGDDWQAIFGFQGGDVDLIRQFKDPTGANEGALERIELVQTYRFGQPIADSTRRFVIRGRRAIDRKVVGAPTMAQDPRWTSSIVIASSRLTLEGKRKLGGRHNGLTGGVLVALERIGEQSAEAEVLVIARRNSELERPAHGMPNATGIDRTTIDARARRSNIRVTCSTVLVPHVPCPACKPRGRTTAVLAIHKGPSGGFTGCTSFRSGPDHHCGHTERLCERCGEGLMIRFGNGRAKCQNPECRCEAPLCRCTIPLPMVERRHRRTGERFWGCQRYGMDGSCEATKRWEEPDESGNTQSDSDCE